MKAALITIFVFISSQLLAGDIIKIGLFHHDNVNGVNVSILSGEYQLKKNDAIVKKLHAGDKISVSYLNGAIILNQASFSTSASTKLELVAITGDCHMLIKPKTKKTQRKITGHLAFWNRGKRMSIINTQNIDTYIAGVVEAESGPKQNKEYYKVQAVICRTYALANKNRHAASGFHLCDAVHCQVYHGESEKNPIIREATLETSDVVVVDQDINLITTAFHSNCGGRTINSEDVWSKAVPYLKAVTDTFCLNMPHAEWEKPVRKVHWMGFLNKRGINSTHDSLRNFSYTHDYTHFSDEIHLKEIRNEFSLKSTYFSASEKDGTIFFSGRGYGHGVGLCQEGAMSMSQSGYDYLEILHFYFTDIHVVPLSNFYLFQEE